MFKSNNREVLKGIGLILALFISTPLFCQENSVGVLRYDAPTEGYNLIYPHNQSNVFLINNCGEVVHQWDDDEECRPGNIAYLQEDGTLVRAKRNPALENRSFGAGGSGGIIEWISWEQEKLYRFEILDTLYRAHHDIALLPNGNVIAIVWERKSKDEILSLGGDPEHHQVQERWPDMVVEVDPILDSIVWEWHAWDHLVQSYDSLAPNYKKVRDYSSRIDINTELQQFGLKPDWMHINSIDYNAERDQILLSVPNFNELWIIDHSTTTIEAATNSGGQSGKGGDLLFRWGNPANYGRGSVMDQQSFFQHDARWLLDSEGKETGAISFFNNRVDADSSHVNIISPNWDENLHQYLMEDSMWLPRESYRIITHPHKNIYSAGLSGAQELSNGNFIITVGRDGYAFEISPDENIVWEYKVPLLKGDPVSQGTELETNDNVVFRLNRYESDFLAFQDKDLIGTETIELFPNIDQCLSFIEGGTVDVDNVTLEEDIIIFPNPASNYFNIISRADFDEGIKLFNAFGQEVLSKDEFSSNIDISLLPKGVYWVQIGKQIHKIVKC